MNLIDGRLITPFNVQRMTNCRLKSTREELQRCLVMVETEIETRMGKGGGGLTTKQEEKSE